jgi:hypothetical protein
MPSYPHTQFVLTAFSAEAKLPEPKIKTIHLHLFPWNLPRGPPYAFMSWWLSTGTVIPSSTAWRKCTFKNWTRGKKLTTHLHLVPRSRMRGAIPPAPHYVFMAWFSVFFKKKAQWQLYFTFIPFMTISQFNLYNTCRWNIVVK